MIITMIYHYTNPSSAVIWNLQRMSLDMRKFARRMRYGLGYASCKATTDSDTRIQSSLLAEGLCGPMALPDPIRARSWTRLPHQVAMVL